MPLPPPARVFVESKAFESFEAQVASFAPRGVFVHCKASLPIGTRAGLVFLCPDFGRVHADAEIVVSGESFLGFSIAHAAPEAERALARWAEEQGSAFASVFLSVPPEARPPVDSIPPVPPSLPPDIGWLQDQGPYGSRLVLPPLPVMDPEEMAEFLESDSPRPAPRNSISPFSGDLTEIDPGLGASQVDMKPEPTRSIPAGLVDDLDLDS